MLLYLYKYISVYIYFFCSLFLKINLFKPRWVMFYIWFSFQLGLQSTPHAQFTRCSDIKLPVECGRIIPFKLNPVLITNLPIYECISGFCLICAQPIYLSISMCSFHSNLWHTLTLCPIRDLTCSILTKNRRKD